MPSIMLVTMGTFKNLDIAKITQPYVAISVFFGDQINKPDFFSNMRKDSVVNSPAPAEINDAIFAPAGRRTELTNR